MKVAEINMLPNGSTGKIMFQIAKKARERGIEVRTFSPAVFSRSKKKSITVPNTHTIFGSILENGFHYYVGALFGVNGYFSLFGTRKLIKELKAFRPDIIHLHNIHAFCINIPMLFKYINKNNIQVIWTLHDCWSFTGHCPHFTAVKCDKWKNGCGKCPQPKVYPKMYIDTSRIMYKEKKKYFGSVNRMILVTPSQWLANLTRESFLNKYPVKVINNGIDLSVFKYTESNFRKIYACENKFILLGVAFDWGYRKGLDVFIKLANSLPDDVKIVLVGTNELVDKELPDNIIKIHRTNNQLELAQIYSACDLMVNPTREDSFPTVNIESIACGTPVITFETGGSPEMLNEYCGFVVPCNDYNALYDRIIYIKENRPYSRINCIKQALKYDMNVKFREYVDMFIRVSNRGNNNEDFTCSTKFSI